VENKKNHVPNHQPDYIPTISTITILLFNIAMENGPFIDDFPSYKPPFSSGIFHGELLVITRWYIPTKKKCPSWDGVLPQKKTCDPCGLFHPWTAGD